MSKEKAVNPHLAIVVGRPEAGTKIPFRKLFSATQKTQASNQPTIYWKDTRTHSSMHAKMEEEILIVCEAPDAIWLPFVSLLPQQRKAWHGTSMSIAPFPAQPEREELDNGSVVGRPSGRKRWQEFNNFPNSFVAFYE